MSATLLSLLLMLPAAEPQSADKLFAQDNLTAWCIVPFDEKKRGPEARVRMLKNLGFKKYAYDWRAEHLPTFEKEILELNKAGITLQAVWFPANLGKDGQTLLDLLKKHDISTELWVMLPQPDGKLSQEDKVKQSADLVKNLAQTAAKQNCKIGIYNHGGWSGEPANMVAVAEACGEKNVGIVYNLHHAHSQMKKLAENLKLMKPHLYSVNLNGMQDDGEAKGNKILVIGQGTDDAAVLKTVRESGYAGPVGILGHTNHDAEHQLLDNLGGLASLLNPALPKAAVRTSALNEVNIRTVTNGTEQDLTFLWGNFVGNEVKQWDKQIPKPEFLAECCPVYVVTDPNEDVRKNPAMLGAYSIQTGQIQFIPRFPLSPDVRYRAYCDRAKLFGKKEPDLYFADFIGPPPRSTTSFSVKAVYPTASTLPENTLRVYVHFPIKMRRGDVYKHLQLLNEDGKPVKKPFLELDEELWSVDGTRFTILFDPGRVKRGLKPREEDGPILEEGKKFTLVISKNWKDEYGNPLKVDFRKAFNVVAPDDKPVDHEKWKITPPTQDKPELIVKFEKPLDSALAKRMIWVVGPDDKPMSVEPVLSDSEQTWTLKAKSWPAGKYKLIADTRLEDVCGNSIGKPFELDVFKPVQKKIEGKTVERVFEVK